MKSFMLTAIFTLSVAFHFAGKPVRADSPFQYQTITYWGVDFYRNYSSIPADVIKLCHHFYKEWADGRHVNDDGTVPPADGVMQPDERYNLAPNSRRLFLSNTGLVYVDPAKRDYWLDRVTNLVQVVRLVPKSANCSNYSFAECPGTRIDVDALDGEKDVESSILTLRDLYGDEGPLEMDDAMDCGENQDPAGLLYCSGSEGLPVRTGEQFNAVAEFLGTMDLGGGFTLGFDDFSSIGSILDTGYIAFNSWTQPFAGANGYFTAEIYFANTDCSEDYISDAKPVTPDLPHCECGEDEVCDVLAEGALMPSLTDFTNLHLVKVKDLDRFRNM